MAYKYFRDFYTYIDAAKGTWVLSGAYDHALVRVANDWKVRRMKMSIVWETGNRPA